MRENSGRCLLLRVSASLFLTMGVFSPRFFGQEIPPASAQNSISRAAPFAGCYELQLGRWWPWSMGEDTEFATPPRRIELQLRQGTDGFERDGFAIRTIPAVGSSRRKAYWQPQGSEGVSLIWTDGFTGVTLRLTKHGKELRGWAHPHFDSARLVPHVAHVTASPILCGSVP